MLGKFPETITNSINELTYLINTIFDIFKYLDYFKYNANITNVLVINIPITIRCRLTNSTMLYTAMVIRNPNNIFVPRSKERAHSNVSDRVYYKIDGITDVSKQFHDKILDQCKFYERIWALGKSPDSIYNTFKPEPAYNGRSCFRIIK